MSQAQMQGFAITVLAGVVTLFLFDHLTKNRGA